ncbi:MAG TPA: glucose 1-dehydrogenase [Pantanalinema sp.]
MLDTTARASDALANALPNFRLTDKVAVVTGAGSGLGKAIALGFAASGAKVVLTELPGRMALAEETISEIEGFEGEALAVALDITSTESIEAVFEAAVGRFGGIDVLVNNAGINIPKPALEVTEEDWDKVLDINLKGTFFACQAAGRRMVAQGRGGRIVNITSQNGVVGYYKRAAYCSSKAGVVNLTRVLAIEWAEHGINVNSVGPTFVETPLTAVTFADPGFREDILRRLPVGRLGTPEEIVGAVVYLASPASSLVTGQTLLVDGGWTAL